MSQGLGNHVKHVKYVMPRDSKTTRFKKIIALSEEHYDWIKEHKGKKSAAGFLEMIIEEYRKPNLFKNGNKQNKKNKD